MSQESFHNAPKRHDTTVLKCTSFINHKLKKQTLTALKEKVLNSKLQNGRHSMNTQTKVPHKQPWPCCVRPEAMFNYISQSDDL